MAIVLIILIVLLTVVLAVMAGRQAPTAAALHGVVLALSGLALMGDTAVVPELVAAGLLGAGILCTAGVSARILSSAGPQREPRRPQYEADR